MNHRFIDPSESLSYVCSNRDGIDINCTSIFQSLLPVEDKRNSSLDRHSRKSASGETDGTGIFLALIPSEASTCSSVVFCTKELFLYPGGLGLACQAGLLLCFVQPAVCLFVLFLRLSYILVLLNCGWVVSFENTKDIQGHLSDPSLLHFKW